MKSDTYQKEGWFILEADNRAFGAGAEGLENETNLESEDFIFYHQNKEEAKKDIDSSAKELTDFIDSLIKDIPGPTQEEKAAGIEKIINKAHPETAEIKPLKRKRSKKAALKVLFIAAVLSAVCFSSLFAVGNARDISIENGFISFARETVQVVFFGEEEADFISVDALLEDLEKHGFEDILFPEIFITNSDEYKSSVARYKEGDFVQVAFDVYKGDTVYKFGVYEFCRQQQSFDYTMVENIKTVSSGDISVYISNGDNGELAAEFTNENYRYFITADIPCSEMVDIINTVN